MIYVISDIHGRIDLFNEMLEKINFSDNDILYVLGDTIDRGGLSVLLKVMEMEKHGQARLIAGNHEKNLLTNIETYISPEKFKSIESELKNEASDSLSGKISKISGLGDLFLKLQSTMFDSNAYKTFDDFISLPDEKKEEVKEYLELIPLCEFEQINGKTYLLTHAGNTKYSPISDIRYGFYSKKNPFDGVITIFGHTPTKIIKLDMEGKLSYPPEIWFDKVYNDKIGIDCGACFEGGRLACLRLDDMKEFYVDNKNRLMNPMKDFNDYINKITQFKPAKRGS